jgi:hypothetical protein
MGLNFQSKPYGPPNWKKIKILFIKKVLYAFNYLSVCLYIYLYIIYI